MASNRDQFYSWLQTLLKDKGWQISRSGSKVREFNENQRISEETGYWANPTYTASKPPRWLIHFGVNEGQIAAFVPEGHRSERIGQGNTAQANVVGIAVRIVPIFRQANQRYYHHPSWEWNLLFLMPYPVPVGSSSETFDYHPSTGILSYKDQRIEYIFSSLLGVQDPTEFMDLDGVRVTYEDATNALRELLHVAPLGLEISNISVFDLFTEDSGDLSDLKQQIAAAISTAPSPPVSPSTNSSSDDEESDNVPPESLPEIEEDKDLLGIDPIVYRQINAALKSGKQHLMLYGPPGTGKTTLARWIATQLSGNRWNLITGSADWSSQDIIGGYQPVGDGRVAFIPGILLKTFDAPLIIDELNRCDIDKVLGPLFTVLSGHYTALPYRTKVDEPDSPAYVILPSPKPSRLDHEYAPGERWRLIATINSIDKASLYQMSYALSRRFGWIFVDAPSDRKQFLWNFLKTIDRDEPTGDNCPLSLIWDSVNEIRVLGPAPFIDMIKAVLAMDQDSRFFERPSEQMKEYLLDAFDMFILPLMDGILRHEADQLAAKIGDHLDLVESHRSRINKRLHGVSI